MSIVIKCARVEADDVTELGISFTGVSMAEDDVMCSMQEPQAALRGGKGGPVPNLFLSVPTRDPPTQLSSGL